jgi:ribosome maturation factor RimP
MAETQKQTIESKAQALVEPVVAAEGIELVDLEFIREREGWILRVFIDKPGGVNLDDCSHVSRALDTALDVEDIIPHEYHLEVSSPGLNRPLKKAAHFEKAQGKRVKVKTYGPIGDPGRKNFTGILKQVNAEVVTVDVEGGGLFEIPLKDIAKANIEHEF